MKSRMPDDVQPIRFVEGGRGDPLDHLIGTVLRHAVELRALPPGRVQAVWQRLTGSAQPVRRPTFRYVAILGLVLLCVAAVAAIGSWRDHDHRESAPSPAELRPEGISVPAISVPLTSAMAEPVGAPSISAPSRDPSRAVPQRRAPTFSSLPSPPAAATSARGVIAETSSTLGAEARLLRRAIESLRVEANPRKTLALLDDYRTGFPEGYLHANAELLKVEALLALDRRSEALTLLEGLPLDGGPRDDERMVTRGELRADADCPAAVRDFDKALARPLPEELAERALRGRLVCRLRAGERSIAEPDLRAYLQRFPNGKFAARARELLDAAVPGRP
jgi:hypothetical protein